MDRSPLDDLLARLPDLETGQVRAMRGAWEQADPTVREAAWRAAAGELRRQGRSGELEWARTVVSRWVNEETPSLRKVFAASGGADDDPLVRLMAVPPIMDAVLAIVAANLLDQDERYALSKPWRTAMHRLPERARVRRRGTRPNDS